MGMSVGKGFDKQQRIISGGKPGFFAFDIFLYRQCGLLSVD